MIYHHIDRIDLLIAHVHLDNGYVTHAEGISCYLIFVDLYLIVASARWNNDRIYVFLKLHSCETIG